jgi:pantoate--beta-alanine ligase
MSNNRFQYILKRNLHIIKTVKEMRDLKRKLIQTNKTIGFVPTMGALHQGHITLMEQAKLENDIAIASIYVNPTQFSAGEDFDKYPRTIEKDAALVQGKIDYLFAPNESEIYPYGKHLKCHVEPTPFNKIYEGVIRPEFFRGVATIVCKLLNIVQPDYAYFGQKDISQCILVRQLVNDLNIST